jgi:uncharacterized protein (DUF488 family)
MGRRLHLAQRSTGNAQSVSVPATLFSFGHSTRTQEEILEILAAHEIERVVDVRAYPSSRKHPHVGRDVMAGWLAEAGISYEHIRALGGRRRPALDSPNRGWTNKQFGAYADHMATDQFKTGLTRLLGLCADARTTCMCSEAQWWRCHRRLLCDAALVAGHPAVHLMSRSSAVAHDLTPFAVVEGDELRYPQPAT